VSIFVELGVADGDGRFEEACSSAASSFFARFDFADCVLAGLGVDDSRGAGVGDSISEIGAGKRDAVINKMDTISKGRKALLVFMSRTLSLTRIRWTKCAK
jgi:hypothetical protein